MKRPRVIALNTASIDGRLAISRDVLLLQGDPRWEAMDSWSPAPPGGVFETLRAHYAPGATLEGSGSLVREGEPPALKTAALEALQQVTARYIRLQFYRPRGMREKFPTHAGRPLSEISILLRI